jgi:hypothetical protein
MSNRDWDKELAEIDRRLAAVPEEPQRQAAPTVVRPDPPRSTGGGALPAAPPASGQAAAAPRRVGTPAEAAGRRSMRTQLALLLRLAFGAAIIAALIYWPYPARCGVGLGYYLALVGVLAIAGLWTSVAAWRHRAPLVHLIGLTMLVAAGGLGAREVLPKIGYAFPSETHPADWRCV